MVLIFNKIDDLINSLVKINSHHVKNIYHTKFKNFPISNCYYLTLLNDFDDNEIIEFFNYINDDTRSLKYPYVKDEDIDYSLMLENEQFYNLTLFGQNKIKNISNNIDDFIEIVSESDGKILLVLDISYLINYMVKLKNQSIPDFLIDLITFKILNLPNIIDIYILDREFIVKNNSNILYKQFEMCINKNLNISKIDNNIIVYRDVESSPNENLYWNILDDNINIPVHHGKIKSPYDDSYFNIMQIDNNLCYVKKINILEFIDKNLFTKDKNPGIIIHPLDRLNLFM